jgi:hypothetical protein
MIETLATALPYTTGRWLEQMQLGDADWCTKWHDVDDGRMCILSIGDGCTTQAGYAWQTTTHREDGLYEHVYRRDDGK